MQFLRDPFVQFIISNLQTFLFGIITVVATIFSFVTYFKQRDRKEITWERLSITPVKHLKNAKSIFLKIWNSGDVPIEENDYLDPIKFNFGKGAKVTKVEVVDTSPPGLKAAAGKSLKSDPENLNKIIIAPLLLNAKYLINFKVQLTGFRGEIIPENTTRIIGLYDFFEKRPVAEIAKGKVLLSSIVFILGGQVLGIGLQLLLHPAYYRFGLILGTFIYCVSLFFKSFSPAVFFYYGYGWNKKIKSFKSLFWLWTKVSIVLAIATFIMILPVLLFLFLLGLPV